MTIVSVNPIANALLIQLLSSNMAGRKFSKETKLKFHLVAVYSFLIIGFSSPIVNCLWGSNTYEKFLKIVVPALAAILVAWFHKLAAQLMQERGAFAIPGVYELRQKYLLHVNRLEWAWLILASYVAVWSAL